MDDSKLPVDSPVTTSAFEFRHSLSAAVFEYDETTGTFSDTEFSTDAVAIYNTT
jgi:hypothetical protein